MAPRKVEAGESSKQASTPAMSDFDAEADLHTITRAAEVHGDSRRLRAARKVFAKRQRLGARALGTGRLRGR